MRQNAEFKVVQGTTAGLQPTSTRAFPPSYAPFSSLMAAWQTTASSRVFNSTHLSATTSSPARKQTTRRPITAPQFSSSMGYHQSPCGEAGIPLSRQKTVPVMDLLTHSQYSPRVIDGGFAAAAPATAPQSVYPAGTATTVLITPVSPLPCSPAVLSRPQPDWLCQP